MKQTLPCTGRGRSAAGRGRPCSRCMPTSTLKPAADAARPGRGSGGALTVGERHGGAYRERGEVTRPMEPFVEAKEQIGGYGHQGPRSGRGVAIAAKG